MSFSIKRVFDRFMAKRGYLKKGVWCETEWHGSLYGGYPVCPTCLNSDPVVYSFGLGEDISFDRSVGKQHNACVFGFDPTPKVAAWIEKQVLPEKFRFEPIALGVESGTAEFFLPKNPEHISGSLSEPESVNCRETVEVPVRSFEELARGNGHTRVDVLKIDIEGTEYDVMEGILDSGILIGQILIEFHDRLYPYGRQRTKNTVALLNRRGYEIFAVDSRCEVVGFIRRELV